jgi:hypothetical protein
VALGLDQSILRLHFSHSIPKHPPGSHPVSIRFTENYAVLAHYRFMEFEMEGQELEKERQISRRAAQFGTLSANKMGS